MRVSILHDQLGNVVGLAASPPGAPVSHLESPAGNFITVMDMEAQMRSLKPEEISARLVDIAQNYKVEMGSTPAKLTKK